VEQKPVPAPAPEPAPAAAPRPKAVEEKHALAPARPPLRLASVRFHIKPRGDVFVDGVAKGRTPPLSRIELRPGTHTIEVRNGEYPPLKLRVNLGEAEEMTVTHSFVTPHQQKEGLIPRWRRKLGL
ncbi:MAG: PEGA domain-containing protein, partial [Burkholderiales bacterium]